MSSALRSLLAVSAIAAFAACGGGDAGPTPPVNAPVTTVLVTPDVQTLSPTQTLQLVATLRDAAGNVLTGRSTAWSATPSAIGSVTATGLVSAIAPGALTITATSEGRSGSAQITVISNSPVATITVSSPVQTLIPQGTVQLAVLLKDASGNALTGRSVAWAVTPSTVGSISASGVVTAIAQGTLTVTATCEGKSVSTTLAVVSGAMVGPTGGTFTLSGGDVEVQVPAGAVSANTMITSVPTSQPSMVQPAGWRSVGTQYALGPVGTTFAQPVTVKVKFGVNDLPAYAMSGDLKLRMASAGQWSSLSNVAVDAANKTIVGRTTTFGASSSALSGLLMGFGRDTPVSAVANQWQAGEPTIGVGAEDPTILIAPRTASVNAQHRSVVFIASIPPKGTGVPLPANTPAPLYRWSTTGRNGALSGPGPTQWTTTTDVQYTATNAVLNQLSGPIDEVKVELLLNPGETDPVRQRIVSATATVDADLDKTYDVLPSSPVLAPSEAKNLQLLIRDKQGAVLALPPSQSLAWTTSGVFGNIGTPGPRQETVTYRANASVTGPPPRLDDVTVRVTEVRNTVIRVFRPGIIGGEGAYDDTTVVRTVTIAEKRILVDVRVNYQVSITPSPANIAANGNTSLAVSLAPAYTGPGLMYRWTNPGAYGALSVTNGTRTLSPSVTYKANGTGGGTDQVKVDVVSVVAGVELETLGSATVNVVVDSAKLGWRVTNFTVIAQSGIAQSDCTSFCNIFTRLETAPGKGFFFAFPNALATPLNPFVPTPGVHLLLDIVGNGDAIRDYPRDGAAMYSILHRFNQSYQASRPASGTFIYTGDAVTGSMSGSSTPVFQNSFYDFRMTFSAVKDGEVLTGELELVTFPFATPSTNWHTKKWRFRAVRIP
jgi:hypothetical protein